MITKKLTAEERKNIAAWGKLAWWVVVSAGLAIANRGTFYTLEAETDKVGKRLEDLLKDAEVGL